MTIYLEPEQLCELDKLHLNATHFITLDYLYHSDFVKADKVPGAIFQTLLRKGYISKENDITDMGRKLYDLITGYDFSTVSIKRELKKAKSDQDSRYLQWLSLYPATATWVDSNGKQWINTRILRKNSVENEQKYLSILAAGKYTQEELCNALLFQIDMVKKESMKYNENKMIYFQGTGAYLTQETFIKEIETMKMLNWKPTTTTNPEVNEKSKNSMLL